VRFRHLEVSGGRQDAMETLYPTAYPVVSAAESIASVGREAPQSFSRLILWS
jgi:hypothetical protein